MTSDTKQFGESEDHGSMAGVAREQSEQAATPHSSSSLEADRIKPRFRPANAVSLRSRGVAHSSLSTGYIPIQAKALAEGEAVEDDGRAVAICDSAEPPVAMNQPPVLEAFESLDRDLAELASACSSLGARPDLLHTNFTNSTDRVGPSQSLGPISHSSHEESLTMNAQAPFQQEKASADAATTRASTESAVTHYQSSVMETDGVLHDVQSTLDSLAGMAQGLSQQKLEVVKLREALEERRLTTVERERQLAEREDRLAQLEQRLQEEKQGIERVAEQNAAVLAERSSALQALAETVDSRDRATSKRAEVLNQEQQGIDRQLNQMRARAQELDDREAGLQRQGAELADRFKQLLDAKERFGVIVRGFNETVRFNTTYSAISKTVATSEDV
ncbi:hypothetical protein ACLUTX_21445 [Enterobacterales bacterium AE_CKDN230030158-1A_HGKHYDSX7]